MRNSIIIAGALFLVYGLFLEYGPKPVKVITQSQWQDNQYAIEKYFQNSRMGINQHKVVYVGSSLTKRLDFDMNSNCVYNLSFGGDSALTGLSAIAISDTPPRLVFMEINVPERSINQNLINKGAGLLPQLSAIFYTENMPINRALSFLQRQKKDQPVKEVKEVNESVLQNALALEVQKYQAPISSDILKINMAEYSRLIKVIESKGTKVILFEMPIHPDLEPTLRAEQIRSTFRNIFPNHQLLSSHDLTKGKAIKTLDGEHLSPSEAKNVAENMRLYFNDSCVNDFSNKGPLYKSN